MKRLYGTVHLAPAVLSGLRAGAGLRVIGTLGLLLKAKRLGMLPSMVAAIGELRAAGMWIGDGLATNILAEAGER